MCPASSIAHQPYGVVARPAGSTCCTALCSSTAHLGRARVVVMCCLRPPFPSTIAVGVENGAKQAIPYTSQIYSTGTAAQQSHSSSYSQPAWIFCLLTQCSKMRSRLTAWLLRLLQAQGIAREDGQPH